MTYFKQLFFALIALSITGGFAQAAPVCPEGKSELRISTPSGIQKILCVSDSAINGIESAADHSPTAIVPGTCPCWTQEEFNLLKERNTDMLCANSAISQCGSVGDLITLWSCNIPGFKLLELGDTCGDYPSRFCRNNASIPVIEKLIGYEEYNACLAISEL